MKKHNEGYSLVLVLVVLTLMSLVASFILSVSLKNLQSQTAAVNRMEQEYAAAGEIEKIVAELEALIGETEPKTIVLTDASPVEGDGKHITVSVTKESVKINCTLRLTAESVEYSESTKEFTITKLTATEYLTYEVTAADEEVTPDE